MLGTQKFPEVEEVVKNTVPFWRSRDTKTFNLSDTELSEASDPEIPIHREPRGSSKAPGISYSF